MNLQEYLGLYMGGVDVEKEMESNYPLPPTFFDVMEFLEVQQY